MISNHISSALRTTGVRAEVLNAPETKALFVRLRERFGIDVRAHAAWEVETESDSKQRSDGWELIPTFVGASTCYMFLERADADMVWKFSNGSDLLRVLGESPPLEFYVCDRDPSNTSLRKV
jgi:hypothetical protein